MAQLVSVAVLLNVMVLPSILLQPMELQRQNCVKTAGVSMP
jgi:hypothetical protein